MANNPLSGALSEFADLYGNDGNSFIGTIIDIDINMIGSFSKHPFKVLDDERMNDLVDSIRENGVLTPVLVRKASYGTYEMISGHRRLRAASLAGLTKIPAKVEELDDCTAAILVVDSNIQREEILPSEKAFAYKLRFEAMAMQGKRVDVLEGYYGQSGNNTYDRLAEELGEKARTIRRFLRLTYLISSLLDRIDRKEIGFMMGVELSYLPKSVQEYVEEFLYDGGILKKERVVQLKNYHDLANIDLDTVMDILDGYYQEDKSEEVSEQPEPQNLSGMVFSTDTENNKNVQGLESQEESPETEEDQRGEEPEYIQKEIPNTPNQLQNTTSGYKRRTVAHSEKWNKYLEPSITEEEVDILFFAIAEFLDKKNLWQVFVKKILKK